MGKFAKAQGSAVTKAQRIALKAERDQLYFDVFVTAMEGGIGYWSVCTEYHWKKTPFENIEDLEGFYAKILADTPAIEYTIDRKIIKRGIRKAYEYFRQQTGVRGYHKTALRDMIFHPVDADYDADTADMIVQFGLFGELVYG